MELLIYLGTAFVLLFLYLKFTPSIDWFICDIKEDVQIYQVLLWYTYKNKRKFIFLFKI